MKRTRVHIFTSADIRHDDDEPPYFGEVAAVPIDPMDDGEILHTTSWFHNEIDARRAAVNWAEEHGARIISAHLRR